jgi:hypothetical protein
MIGSHGHVRPRPDGLRARCEGPGICPVCNQEEADEAIRLTKLNKHSSEVREAIECLRELCYRLDWNELVNRPNNECNYIDQPYYDRAVRAIEALGGEPPRRAR